MKMTYREYPLTRTRMAPRVRVLFSVPRANKIQNGRTSPMSKRQAEDRSLALPHQAVFRLGLAPRLRGF